MKFESSQNRVTQLTREILLNVLRFDLRLSHMTWYRLSLQSYHILNHYFYHQLDPRRDKARLPVCAAAHLEFLLKIYHLILIYYSS